MNDKPHNQRPARNLDEELVEARAAVLSIALITIGVTLAAVFFALLAARNWGLL